MTTVNLKYRRIDGVNPEGTPVTSGLVEVNPAYRSDTGSGQMTTTTQTFPVGQSITLAGGTYLFKLRAPDGKGGRLKDEGVYRLVPASGTFDVDDLTEVIPTAQGLTQSDVAVMIANAIAGIVVGPGGTPTGSGPGGAFVIADVTDASPVGENVVKALDQAAARLAIGAGTSSLVLGTTAGTAADGTAAASAATALSTANSASTTATNAAAAVATKADLVSGKLPLTQSSASSVLYVKCPGDVMAARPTNRTDVLVVWLKKTQPTGGGFPNAEPADAWWLRDI